ncbi:hypothetical protein [Streptomyces sp. NPDC047886]|uniref:hypothetical protein n=1 Tax=Streptomyces sp. NPDC047886 TaxID=3365490 RepID=UPI00371C4229
MHVRPTSSGGFDLATAADTFAAWLLDRIGIRFYAPTEQPGKEELAAAWKRVRSKPGRLSTKTSDEWSRIESFMGVSGFGWLLLTVVVGVLFLITPVTGWAGSLAYSLILITASLTTGLAATRLAVHFAATAAISHSYASNRRIRTVAFLLRTRAVLVVALVAATVLYLSFGLQRP